MATVSHWGTINNLLNREPWSVPSSSFLPQLPSPWPLPPASLPPSPFPIPRAPSVRTRPPLRTVAVRLRLLGARRADTPPEKRDDSTRLRRRPSSWPAAGVSRVFDVPNAGWVAVAMVDCPRL